MPNDTPSRKQFLSAAIPVRDERTEFRGIPPQTSTDSQAADNASIPLPEVTQDDAVAIRGSERGDIDRQRDDFRGPNATRGDDSQRIESNAPHRSYRSEDGPTGRGSKEFGRSEDYAEDHSRVTAGNTTTETQNASGEPFQTASTNEENAAPVQGSSNEHSEEHEESGEAHSEAEHPREIHSFGDPVEGFEYEYEVEHEEEGHSHGGDAATRNIAPSGNVFIDGQTWSKWTTLNSQGRIAIDYDYADQTADLTYAIANADTIFDGGVIANSGPFVRFDVVGGTAAEQNAELLKADIETAFNTLERVGLMSFTHNDGSFQNTARDMKIMAFDGLAYSSGGLNGRGTFPTTDVATAGPPIQYEGYMVYNVSPSSSSMTTNPELGAATNRLHVAIHETMHTLGVLHPHSGWTSSATTSTDNVLDNDRYTVMSYERGGLDVNFQSGTFGYSATPMVIDIAILHHLYGSSTNHTGATVYNLTDPATVALDLDGNDGSVSIGRAFYGIWDTAGTDRIQYSGTKHAVINLNNATLDQDTTPADIQAIINLLNSSALFASLLPSSTAGELRNELLNNDYFAGGFGSRVFDNSGAADRGGYYIANNDYATGGLSTLIENATGGNLGDILIGNTGANYMSGNGGGDILFGSGGDDTLIGGSGNDELDGGADSDIIIGGTGRDTVRGGTETDFLQINTGHLSAGEIYNGGSGSDWIQLFPTVSSTFDFRTSTVTSIENLEFNSQFSSTSHVMAIFNQSQWSINRIQASGAHTGVYSIAIHMSNGGTLDLSGVTHFNMNAGDGFRVYGNSGRERITGSSLNDSLEGNYGSDTISGGGGNDRIFAFTAADTTGSNVGDDLSGDGGNDSIYGSNGNDTISGGTGADLLHGGNGTADVVTYATSSSGVTVNLGNGAASGGDAQGDTVNFFEYFIGSNSGDTVYGSSVANRLEGGDGADELTGNAGQDTLLGGSGNDTLRAGNLATHVQAGEVYDGGADTDTLIVNGFSALTKQFENTTLTSLETLRFEDNSTSLSGDLVATMTVAQFEGAGFNRIEGSAHSLLDFVLRLDMGVRTTVDLSGVTVTGFGTSTSGDYIHIVGDGSSEVFTGSEIQDSIVSGDGTDTFIVNGSGSDEDTLIGGTGSDKIEVRGDTDMSSTRVQLSSIEEIEFYSNAVSGDRTLMLNAQELDTTGEVSFTALIDGNAAGTRDILDITLQNIVLLNLSGWTFQDWGGDGDHIVVRGDGSSERVTGSVQDDLLLGSGGADTLLGLGGDDTIEGGDGDDSMDGGDGLADVLSYANATSGLTVNLGNGAAVGYAAGDVFTGFEYFEGSIHRDVVFGGSAANVLNGNGGDDNLVGDNGMDSLFGGSGNDTLRSGNNASTVEAGEIYDGGADTDEFHVNAFSPVTKDFRLATLTSLEILGFSQNGSPGGPGENVAQFNIDQFVSAGFQTVTSRSNSLIASVVELHMDTAMTADLSSLDVSGFAVTNSDDRFNILGDADHEMITGSMSDDSISGNSGRDTLLGGSGDDTLIGGKGTDSLVGGAGFDLAIWNQGDASDSFDGGADFDIQRVNLDSRNADVISFDETSGLELQRTNRGLFQIELTDVEVVEINGLGGNDTITGHSGSDIIRGGVGADSLSGGGYQDTIEGGAGGDFLDGGDSAYDVLSYEGSVAGVTVDLGTGAVSGGDAAGDTISNFEHVIGSANADHITGDDSSNSLEGMLGNDTLIGGLGRDVLFGGDGDDVLQVGDSAASVEAGELYSGGSDIGGSDIDTLLVSGSTATTWDFRGVDVYDVEVLAFEETGSPSAPGDLTAQFDASAFVTNGFESVSGASHSVLNYVLELHMGDSTNIDLSPISTSAFVSSDPGANVHVIGDSDAETIGGTDSNDSISGNGGADSLVGGAGDDTLTGGKGVDTVEGGMGDDLAIWNHGDSGESFDGGGDTDTMRVNLDNRNADVISYDESGGLTLQRTNRGTFDLELIDVEAVELNGMGGDDTLGTHSGIDIIDGGADTDLVSYRDAGAGVVVEGTAIGESGSATVTQAGYRQWHSVSFGETITDAVVVLGPISYNGTDPMVTRVRNVTDTGFEFQMDEWNYLNGAHIEETVSWMAISAGTHELADGRQVVAGLGSANQDFSTQSFASDFANAPVVLAQVSSANGGAAVTTRLQNVTTGGFDALVQEEEAADGIHNYEQISYIAIDAGGNADNGMIAGVTALTGGNNVVTDIAFGDDLEGTPAFLATMQSFVGADPVALRLTDVDGDNALVKMEEEKSANAEVSHTSEQVGYLATDMGQLYGRTVENGAVAAGNAMGDSYRDVEAIEGSAYADKLSGFGNIETLSGLGGDDTLAGARHAELLDGGADNDLVSYRDATAGVVVQGAAIGEVGSSTVAQSGSAQWHSVSFSDAISNAVVVMGPVSFNGADPMVTRVRNVTDTGFEFQLDEWNYLNGVHAAETVSWMAISAGTHELADGRQVVAGVGSSNHNFSTQSFADAFDTAPVVLAQVSSVNGGAAVTPRLSNINTAGFDALVAEEEGADGVHNNEQISYIAIEAGGDAASGLISGTADLMAGNNAVTDVIYGDDLGATPAFLASIQSYNDADTVALRTTLVDGDNALVMMEEERSNDPEVAHGLEQVGFLAADFGQFYARTVSNSATGAASGDARGDSYRDVERLEGSDFGDSLHAFGSITSIDALGGDDFIYSSDKADTIDGGDDRDVVIYDGTQAEFTNINNPLDSLQTLVININTSVTDVLTNVEILRFTDGDVIL